MISHHTTAPVITLLNRALPFLAENPLPQRITKVHKGYFKGFFLRVPLSPLWLRKTNPVKNGRPLNSNSTVSTVLSFTSDFSTNGLLTEIILNP